MTQHLPDSNIKQSSQRHPEFLADRLFYKTLFTKTHNPFNALNYLAKKCPGMTSGRANPLFTLTPLTIQNEMKKHSGLAGGVPGAAWADRNGSQQLFLHPRLTSIFALNHKHI